MGKTVLNNKIHFCDLDPVHYTHFTSVLFMLKKHFKSYYARYFLSVSKPAEPIV